MLESMEGGGRPACRGWPTEWWYSEKALDADSIDSTELAKAMCRGCPIRQDCYDGAVARREDDGVWGGVVFPGEWRELRRLRSRAAVGLDAFADLDELEFADERARRRRLRARSSGAVPEVRTA